VIVVVNVVVEIVVVVDFFGDLIKAISNAAMAAANKRAVSKEKNKQSGEHEQQ
jgi:hypothetical protein